MPKIKLLLGGRQAQLDGGLVATWEPGRVLVSFRNGRKQVVGYRTDGAFYRFWSVVVGPAAAKRFADEHLAHEILKRNRAVDVIGFVRTSKGAIEARVEQRAATFQRDELLLYLAIIAREADRFEHSLTGEDRQ